MAWGVGAGGGHPAPGVCAQCDPTYFVWPKAGRLPPGNGVGGGESAVGWCTICLQQKTSSSFEVGQ